MLSPSKSAKMEIRTTKKYIENYIKKKELGDIIISINPQNDFIWCRWDGTLRPARIVNDDREKLLLPEDLETDSNEKEECGFVDFFPILGEKEDFTYTQIKKSIIKNSPKFYGREENSTSTMKSTPRNQIPFSSSEVVAECKSTHKWNQDIAEYATKNRKKNKISAPKFAELLEFSQLFLDCVVEANQVKKNEENKGSTLEDILENDRQEDLQDEFEEGYNNSNESRAYTSYEERPSRIVQHELKAGDMIAYKQNNGAINSDGLMLTSHILEVFKTKGGEFSEEDENIENIPLIETFMGFQKLHANWVVQKVTKFKKNKNGEFENVPVTNSCPTKIHNYTLKPGRLEEKYIEHLKKDFEKGMKEKAKENGIDMDRDYDAEIRKLKNGIL